MTDEEDIGKDITESHPLNIDGNGLANMLYFWNFMRENNKGGVFPDLPGIIRNWLIIELKREELVYDVEDLNTIYKSFDMLSFDAVERARF